MSQNGKPTAEDLTCCYQITVRMPGVRRKANKELVDLNGADPELISVSKTIVDSDEFRAIQRLVNHMKDYVRIRSTLSPILRGGVYQIPLVLVEVVEKRMAEFKAEFAELVERFLDAYTGRGTEGTSRPSLVEEAQARLGQQFELADYPTEAKLRAGFAIETKYIETGVPGKLRSISETLFHAEKEKAEARWSQLSIDMEAVLFAEMKDLTDWMVGALEVSADGKKKSFRRKGLERFGEFLENAPFRNVSGNKDFDQLVETTKRLLAGVDVDGVRDDKAYRESVRSSFETVQGKLAAFVTDQPIRKIAFEEEA